MIRHCADNPIVGPVINVRRLTLTVLAIVIAGFAAPGQASSNATAIRQDPRVTATADDHDPVNVFIGKGNNNQNQPRVFSSTTNRGAQIVSVNGKNTAIQNSFCKKNTRHCKISERLWFPHGW